MLFYWKDRALRWWLLAGCGAIFALVFALYDLPVQAVGYAALLCAALLAGYGVLGSLHYRAKHQKLQQAQNSIGITLDVLPPADGQLEQDYQQLLSVLSAEKASAVLAADEAQTELVDYFTLWAHQIKTPIAAMSLLLQGERPPEPAEISEQLFQIEEYVGMVLSYLRLGSESSDLVLRAYELDDILRQAVRKYAKLFIRKKLALVYEPVGRTVVTDEKWLLFVVEQLLSNAIKYTPKGSVSLLVEGDELLIRDTGIGITPEDLPRVGEKGFTGYNGRTDKKATGIGLYLCRQVLQKLGHGFRIESAPGRGTTVAIGLFRSLDTRD